MARARRRPSRKPKRRSPGLLIGLGVAVVALAAVLWLMLGNRDQRQVAGAAGPAEFDQRLRALCNRWAVVELVEDDPIRKVDGRFVRTWRATLPDSAAVRGLRADIAAAAAGWSATLVSVGAAEAGSQQLRVELQVEVFELELGIARAVEAVQAEVTPVPVRAPTATPRPEPPTGSVGRLAIILDDGGQNLDMLAQMLELPEQVAVSVMPFLPHSAEVAAALNETGHEVWLHLPMEPDDFPARNPGPGAVLIGMSEADIRSTVRSALNNVPHVVGVNNHMGSRATSDLRTMTWVMQELKGRGVAFIDSQTSIHTVAEAAARAQGVAVGRRHVFLDNNTSRKAIRRQLDEAVYRCRMDGSAVAIGHVTIASTLAVLAQDLPLLGDRGAILVRPSELVE